LAIRPQMRFDVDQDLYQLVDACRARKDERSMSDTCRRLLKIAAEKEMLENGVDTLTPILRRILKEELKVSENRMAKIAAKAANAAATAMYMCYQVLGDLGVKNMPKIYEIARRKGVAFVKTPLDEMFIEENVKSNGDVV
jgi:negative regulator of replication initiation